MKPYISPSQALVFPIIDGLNRGKHYPPHVYLSKDIPHGKESTLKPVDHSVVILAEIG